MILVKVPIFRDYLYNKNWLKLYKQAHRNKKISNIRAKDSKKLLQNILDILYKIIIIQYFYIFYLWVLQQHFSISINTPNDCVFADARSHKYKYIKFNLVIKGKLYNLFMLRKYCIGGIAAMAKVVAKNIATQTNYNPLHIAQYFQVKTNKSESNEQITSKYFQEVLLNRERVVAYSENLRSSEFISANEKLHIIQFTKEQIASRFQKITPQAQTIIDNFFELTTIVFYAIFKQVQSSRFKSPQGWKNGLKQLCEAMNQLFPLITPSLYTCFKFLNIVAIYSGHNNITLLNKYCFNVNIKICIDRMMQMPNNTYKTLQILHILKNLKVLSFRVIYYEKDFDVLKFFFLQIKDTWHYNQIERKYTIKNMHQLDCFTNQMLNKIVDILKSYEKSPTFDQEQFQHGLISLLKFRKIHKNNYNQYENLIVKLLGRIPKEKEQNFYHNTFRMFTYARVWIPEYWMKVFSLLDTPMFQNNARFYNLYLVWRLLDVDKENIPKSILQSAEKTLKKVIQKRPNYLKEQIMQDFNSKQSSNQALACQTQIANSLRLINVGLLRTEQFVDIFMVDILIGNEFVIEVNGSIHYIYNLESEKSRAEYNIKTLFRSWYLQKLGYKIIDIDLEEYNDGSLQITRQIYEIFSKYSGKKDCTNFFLPQHKHK